LICGDRGSRGSFYYQAEWDEDIAVLGKGPLSVEAELTIRRTTYLGRTTWRDANGSMPYIPLAFRPPLPAAEAD